LSSRFIRELGELASKFRRDNLVGRNPPRIQFLYASQLIGFQAQRVSEYGLNVSLLDEAGANKCRAEQENPTRGFSD
jgi:hypothetical protein